MAKITSSAAVHWYLFLIIKKKKSVAQVLCKKELAVCVMKSVLCMKMC